MKNLLTTEQLRSKYNPDTVLQKIDLCYKENFNKIKSYISDKNSPIHNYNIAHQISFLETESNHKSQLINNLLSSLKDATYFMLLSKKERLKTTQKMRAFYSELINNYLERVKILTQDSELLSPKQINDPIPKHEGIVTVFNILNVIKMDLESEQKYRKNMPRAGHLTGLQISLGKFFYNLKSNGVNQKDQITIVQNLFNSFNVDWEERDRDNIKVSLQNPAVEYFYKTKKDVQNISNYHYPRSLNDKLIISMVEQNIIFKKRIRRF